MLLPCTLDQTEIKQWLQSNPYPGRGLIMGKTSDGKWIQIYWIMGRSENSRNRRFVIDSERALRTEAVDPEKLADPTLIIYYPMREVNQCWIVSNGDQTDTITDHLKAGSSFSEALQTRTFEPDAPNFTPRISGILCPNSGNLSLSILKSNQAQPVAALQHFYHFERCEAGVGYGLTTYLGDGHPLPSYRGEPFTINLDGTAQQLMADFWNLLNEENRISLAIKTADELLVKNRYQ
jgi:IMP cyclohydrolase